MSEWNEGIIATLRDERDELRKHIAELYVERDQARAALGLKVVALEEMVLNLEGLEEEVRVIKRRVREHISKHGGTDET